MGFWGIEVKPDTPYRYQSDDAPGRLHVTQATLGAGQGKEKSILQCSIGDRSPIYLCSLLPNKNECCSLNIEFDDDDEVVSFSVIGQHSIHLSGYFEPEEQDYITNRDDSDGIDITETESDESSDYDSEEDYVDDFIDDDDDLLMYPSSSTPNSGVVIEEIEDEEKPFKESQPKKSKKKNLYSEDKNTKKHIVAKGSSEAPLWESEDEDGFPISKADEQAAKMEEKAEVIDNRGKVSNKKRKAKTTEQDRVLESENKKKKKKKQKEKQHCENANGSSKEAGEQLQKENMPKKEENPETTGVSLDQSGNETLNKIMDMDKNGSSKSADNSADKKKKNKKNKEREAEGATDKTASNNRQKQISDSVPGGKQVESKPSHVRTYPNGLVVEELALGRPDGKRASPGKQVSVRYIGKLQKNGKIFDSNIGKAPFKFRLGLGQVIKGWDVGVNGMRVGDKRRLTIPPSMGYGQRGAGGVIPPNAWLVFDIELVEVR